MADVHLSKDNNKLGVFIAAALGTLTLMAVVYCIYNQFYTKNIYAHTQLHESGMHTYTCAHMQTDKYTGMRLKYSKTVTVALCYVNLHLKGIFTQK